MNRGDDYTPQGFRGSSSNQGICALLRHRTSELMSFLDTCGISIRSPPSAPCNPYNSGAPPMVSLHGLEKVRAGVSRDSFFVELKSLLGELSDIRGIHSQLLAKNAIGMELHVDCGSEIRKASEAIALAELVLKRLDFMDAKTNVRTTSAPYLDAEESQRKAEAIFDDCVANKGEVDVTKHRDSLVQILLGDSDKAFDEACSFLSKIEGSVEKKAFIEIVTMAVIQASLKDDKLNLRQLQKLNKLIQKYVRNTEEFELICLFAIKNFLVNERPLELSVLTESFRTMYDDSVISVEAFKKWKDDTSIEPKESKGRLLATKALEPFYVFLAEADEDDEDS